MTSSVKECALRGRSTHGVHHAIVEVNIVIGVVLGEVLVARVVPLVVDAVVGLALCLIAHVVVVVVFVVAILHRIFVYGEIYSLHFMCTVSVTVERDNPSVESTLSLQKCCAGSPQTSGTKKKKSAEGRVGKRKGRSK